MLYLGLSWRKRHPIVTEVTRSFRELSVKRAVILNCSGFVLFCLQHLDILKGGAKRKKKKSSKIINNQQNRKKGKAGGPRGTS